MGLEDTVKKISLSMLWDAYHAAWFTIIGIYIMLPEGMEWQKNAHEYSVMSYSILRDREDTFEYSCRSMVRNAYHAD